MDRDPSLWNDDLAPTPAHQRTWSMWHVAALWVGMAVCIPTYLLAADMIQAGLSVVQAVLIVALGNVIVLVPMILNAHPGTRYGIPFPVFARASFGVRGANVPAIARALVACGWFGIQTWIGGGAIYLILAKLGVDGGSALPVLGINALQLACFAAFWALNLWFIHHGMSSIKWLQTLAAPFLLLGGLALLWWALATHGTAAVFDPPGLSGAAFWKAFGPFLTGMVGFWATLALNIPDFSRFCRSQRDQIVGQTIALPATMALFSLVGAAVSMATGVWDPNAVIASFSSPAVVVLGLIALAIATLSTNIAANVVSPANDFSNIAPGRISFRVGGYITAGIGFAILPWKLTNNYVFGWLNGYGALLGPIGGILVADYWIIRRRQLIVDDLYRRGGAYEYARGVNPWAIIALVVGVAPNVPGFLHAVGLIDSVSPVLADLYAYTWFVGFALAGVVYTLGMRAKPALGVTSLVAVLVASSVGCAPTVNGTSLRAVSFGPPAEATCGQELVDTTFVADGTAYYEGVLVYACGVNPQALRIDVTGTTANGTRATMSQRPKGVPATTARCTGDGAAAPASASAETSPGAAGPGSPASAAASTTSSTSALIESTRVDSCPGTISEGGEVTLTRLTPGTELRVRIWSEVPLDLSTLGVTVTHRLVRPSVSDEEWAKHMAKRRPARDDKVLSANVGATGRGAAPPPRVEVQPPRLSDRAVWIPGYWKQFSGAWHWIGGRWDVPITDVRAGRTATAPELPPPPKHEPVTPVGTAALVWAAGYWSWDGAAWVWTSGRWQEAPSPGARWRPPQWTQRDRLIFIIPGAWIH